MTKLEFPASYRKEGFVCEYFPILINIDVLVSMEAK